MLTKLFPMVQFAKNSWEIDEFDCASIYLLVGTEKAMVIDCGMGIGDLRGAVEMITDKPIVCVISHGHIDHTGNIRQFEDVWMNPKDKGPVFPQSLERRTFDLNLICQRNKGRIGAPYNMYKLYGFDLDTDLREPEEPEVETKDLNDGMVFDLGGRTVTAYECPGHTKGEMVFIDSQTRMMFCGDAINFNLGIGDVPISETLKALKRLMAMDTFDGIMNGHHDFRALGEPLAEDCVPNLIWLIEKALKGNYSVCEVPNFWGQPLSLSAKRAANVIGPIGAPVEPGVVRRPRICLRKGRNFLSFPEEEIR